MNIRNLKNLRAVTRGVTAFNLIESSEYLQGRNGRMIKQRKVHRSKWYLVFDIIHNNTHYAATYAGVMGPRLTSEITWELDDVVAVATNKQMRRAPALVMMEDLLIKGQIKTFDTSDVVLNYEATEYNCIASTKYRDNTYYLKRCATTGKDLILSEEGKLLFSADTIKEAKIGIKQMCINQNK
jgi:hypothetical protein